MEIGYRFRRRGGEGRREVAGGEERVLEDGVQGRPFVCNGERVVSDAKPYSRMKDGAD